MSIPSSSQCSCSIVSTRTACWRGHMKRSASSRFVSNQKPLRSQSNNFTRSRRRLLNASTARANGSRCKLCSTSAASPLMPLRKSTASRCKYTCRSTARRNIAAPQRFNHRTDQLRVLTQALKGQSHAIGQIGIEPGGLRRIRPFASGLAQGRHTSRPLSYCGSAFVLNDRYKRREFLCPVLHDALLSRSPVSPNPFMQQVCVHSMRKRLASYRHARLQARFNQPALRLRIKYPTAISLHSDYWQSITYRFIHVLVCPLSIGWTPILRFYPALRQVQQIERLRIAHAQELFLPYVLILIFLRVSQSRDQWSCPTLLRDRKRPCWISSGVRLCFDALGPGQHSTTIAHSKI